MRRFTCLPVLAAITLAACNDSSIPSTSPSTSQLGVISSAARAAVTASEENGSVSPVLTALNSTLALSGSPLRIAKAELMMDGNNWNGETSTIIFANNRDRGIGAEWVKGDPRRDGRQGVTYAIGSSSGVAPVTGFGPDGSFIFATASQLAQRIEDGLQAWQNRSCARKSFERVPVEPQTDPDFLDEFFGGATPKDHLSASPNYAQPADIVEAGWMRSQFFRNVAGGNAGNNIIGVTFTLSFVDNKGEFTDIDRNGKRDIGLAEIYYNSRFLWNDGGVGGGVDFYSIITHETGHALGLGHFGKLFVTKHAAADGITIADINYAPKAMMNAAYVTGRNEIEGTDNSSFCQIWASN